MGHCAFLVLALLMLIGRSFHTVRALRALCASRTSASSPRVHKHTDRRFYGSMINTDIALQAEERELFEMFMRMVEDEQKGTTVRIAGGWVRDKLLGVRGKEDIDVALDNVSGVEFAQALSEWNEKNVGESIKFGVIQQNPDKSKHLETATASLGKYQIDFVNLRTEKYTDSRIPVIEIGTPQEDAERRDLTINSLFYNVNKQKIEDFTGHGLSDLKAGLARTPLEALTTLTDDPLRALRAIRFSCRFQLTVAPDLIKAIGNPTVHASLGGKVSRERIFAETEQMMQHATGAPRAVQMLHRLNLDRHVLTLPEQEDIHACSPATKLSSTTVLPYDLTDEAGLPKGILENTYHTYGATVAAALAVYDRTFGPVEGPSEVSEEEEASLRGLLNFAALSLYGANAKCVKPAKRGNQGKKTLVPLNLLVLQKLKMRAKDIDVIQTLHESALAFAQILRLYMKSAVADGTTKEAGVPLMFKGVSRLELGLALRDAGPLAEYALRLSVAALMVECLAENNSDLREALALISQCFSSGNDVSMGAFSCDYDQQPSPLEVLLDDPEAAAKAVDIRSIVAAADDFRYARSTMLLEAVYLEQPLLNGKDIMKVFTNIPKGAAFGDIMEEQARWRLQHPTATAADCEAHLKEAFAGFL